MNIHNIIIENFARASMCTFDNKSCTRKWSAYPPPDAPFSSLIGVVPNLYVCYNWLGKYTGIRISREGNPEAARYIIIIYYYINRALPHSDCFRRPSKRLLYTVTRSVIT